MVIRLAQQTARLFGQAILLLVAFACYGDTFQVNSSGDSGPGTLRDAITKAAAISGSHRIEFQLSGPSPYVIHPLSQLPDLRGPIILDASTQIGYAGTPVVELRGDQAGASDGLRLASGFCEVRGLVINRFQRAAIRVLAGTNVIQGNFIGTDSTGRFSTGNGEAGVDLFLGSGNNVVGGPSFLERNVISGNRWGIYVFSPQNNIRGNYIGVDADGLAAAGNGTGIELVRSVRNQIGGSLAGDGNLISGNDGSGIELVGGASDGASFNVIAGNIIGLDATGTRSVANGQQGILVGGNAATNQIGGTTPQSGNLIGGNGGSGVFFQNCKPGNQLLGNFIGVDSTGSNAVPNQEHGVRIMATSQFVGGVEPGSGNLIAYNTRAGIAVEAGTSNLMQGNRIFSNGALGIAVGSNGPAWNDPDDVDEGPNGLQNYPELRSSRFLDGELTIGGALLSKPDRAYLLEFFASPDCDATGAGEGFLFLGRTNLTTASNGAGLFSITFSSGVAAGWQLTATATDPDGDTSEFSPCLPVSTATLVAPLFSDQPLSQSAVAGGSVTFSAAITGDPGPFEYELRRGNVSLSTNVSDARLVFFSVNNLSPASAGSYRIIVRSPATSKLGVASSEAILSVLNLEAAAQRLSAVKQKQCRCCYVGKG